jgi:selenocysteine lyase/cysteine desulfurase
VPIAYVARAGLEVIHEVGVPAIEQWLRVVKRRLVEGALARGLDVLGPTGADQSVATTAFMCQGAPSEAVEAAMRRRGVLASARGPAVRLAPHFYSTIEDVDTSLDVLSDALAEVRAR